ncbi:MAG: sigma D regulator [Gammaproteobacteria bacterium]|nr:MAG: sigma D regulator [Gammaproteobacteria bacterium]
MLNQLDQAKEKWGGYHSLIDRWLEDRQQLLVNFCSLFKVMDTTNQQTLPDYDSLTKFCQQLVDYISLGHFEVYESLVSECDVEGETSLNLAKNLYPEITKTTELALAFNDKYINIKNIDKYEILSKDLSKIGEVLATRIELEDQLIDTLHRNH